MKRAVAVPLFTLGYEGADISSFVAALRASAVRRLIDVRAVPFSRKPDFRQAALAAHLRTAGVDYRHLGALGNPKVGREAAAAGDIAGYLAIMQATLDGVAGQAALSEAARLAAETPSCLMCLEANPARCHRSIVADRLAATFGFTVRHLRGDRQQDLPY